MYAEGRVASSRFSASSAPRSAASARSQSRKITCRMASGLPGDQTCRFTFVSGSLHIGCSCHSGSRMVRTYPAASRVGT